MRRQRHAPTPPATASTAPTPDVVAPWSTRDWSIVLSLIAFATIVFGQLVTHELLFRDDRLLRVAHWWQPLATLSHKLDFAIFGVNAGAHFLINVLLHAAASAVLFVALRKLTGAVGRSAFVAALFAVHPMHVETVAALAERKQLLATLFAILAIHGYAHRRVVLVAVAFAASLLSDPTYVALPLLLLLLDWWPLGRLRSESDLRPLLVEKVPLFVLAIAGGVAAVMGGWSAPPLTNAIASYVRFAGRLIAPTGLAFPYPPETIAPPTVFGAVALLVLISGAAIAFRRNVPWLFVGWFWFVIALTGAQSFADRYSYFSYIGLFIVIAWAGATLPRVMAMAAAAIVIIACAAMAFRQAALWRNGDTLFSHTVAVTPPNAEAEYALGNSLRGKDEEGASEHLQRALELSAYAAQNKQSELPPWFAQAYADIAGTFLAQGEKAPAGSTRTNLLHGSIGASRRALAVDSKVSDAKAIIARAEKLLAADPHSARDSHLNNGSLLSQQGRFTEAIAEFRKAVAADPNSVETHVYLALGLLQANQKEEARAELAAAKTINAAMANEVLTKAIRIPPGPANFDTFVARIR